MPAFTASLAGGANNRAPDNRIPEGQARSIVNAVARADGSLSLAPGSAQVMAGRILGAIPFGRKIALATTSALILYDTETGESEQLVQLARHSGLAGAELNGSLYLRAGAEAFRITPELTLQPWHIKPPRFTVSASSGLLPAGRYAVACTALVGGIESAPSEAKFIDLPDGGGISIAASGTTAQVYISKANGQSLYFQRKVSPVATGLIDSVRDDTAPMRFAGFTAPPAGHTICAVGSQLAIASGRFVYLTAPQMPHLHDPVSGWLAYPAPITGMASDGGTLYVNADKLYAVTGLDTTEPAQSVVLERPAVPGSLVAMIDGGVCALTDRGPLIGQGETTLPARDSFAVRGVAKGAGVQLDADGDRLLLFTRRGQQTTNRLQAISARGDE